MEQFLEQNSQSISMIHVFLANVLYFLSLANTQGKVEFGKKKDIQIVKNKSKKLRMLNMLLKN